MQHDISKLNYDSNKDASEALWPGLTFRDDYVFGAVLKSNLDVTRRLLECILEIPLEKVTVVTPQKTATPSQRAKSVRLDAYVKDGSGRVFDVEMQNYASLQLVKRARYYQSVIDTEQLDRGTSYLDLPDTFIIFFCGSDPFGRGYKRYTYRQACVEDGSFAPWDGTQKVYLNTMGTKGDVSEELQAVLDYLAWHTIGEDNLVRDIEHTVAEVLSSEERRREFVDMQTRMMDERRMGLEEGLEQGREEGREEGRGLGREEGRELGRAEGKSEAMRIAARLSEALVQAGRADELPKAIADPQLFDALCREFGIE